MLRFSRRAVLLGGCASLVACRGDGGDSSPPPPPAPPPPPPPPAPPPPPTTVIVPISFARGLDGWSVDYADYDLAQEPTMNFSFGHEYLPPPLDDSGALFMACDNRSDDVFMYMVKRIEGLVAGQRYRVDSTVTVATNVPPSCPGAGGSPGEANYIKAGATNVRPQKLLRDTFYVVNFDKGDQSNGGANAVVIGNLAQETSGGACPSTDYQRKTLSSGAAGPLVAADSAGGLWLMLGDDSGYEGYVKFYWLDGTIQLVPV